MMEVLALVVSVLSAAIAVGSALSSKRSADEASHTRADGLGPRVFVGDAEALRERWNVSPYGLPESHLGHPPGVAAPDKEFTVPGDNDVRLLMGAFVRARNEGETTAVVSIEGAHRIDRCDDVADVESVVNPTQVGPDTAIRDGRLVLPPGVSAGVIVRVGPSVGEWAVHGDRTHRVSIRAESSPEGARQRWSLDFSGAVLQRTTHNASGYRTVPHRPPTVDLVAEPRSYP